MVVYQQWEYLFVHVGRAAGYTGAAWRPYQVNERVLPNWEKGPLWHEYFQELGTQGWELVALDDTMLDNKMVGGKVAIFKRMKGGRTAMGNPPPFITS
jgi:hypothetical protein